MGVGLPAAMLLSAGIGAGGGLLQSMMGPQGPQLRESFRDTPLNPIEYGMDAKNSISNVLQAATSRANEPVDLSSSLPMSPGSFRGLIPPQSVGGFAANNGTPNRVKFNGFNIGNVGSGSGNFGSDNRPVSRRSFETVMPNEGMQLQDRGGVADKQIGNRFVPGTDTDPDVRDQSGPAAAKLLLHSIFARPTAAAA